MAHGDGSSEPPDDLGKEVCREARLTLDQQLDRIEKYDKKAVGIFRSNILLAGVLISGLAIIVRTNGIGPLDFLNLWSITGGSGIGLSTLLAAMAYTSSSYDMGITSRTISNVERGIYSGSSEFNDDLRDFYRGWLNHNKNVGSFNSFLITGSIIFLMNGIAFFVGCVVIALTPILQSYSNWLFIATLLVVGAADFLVYFSEAFYVAIYGD